MDVSSYVGRTETCRDIADTRRIDRLAATLDHEAPPWSKGVLPPLGHWLCFQPDARQSALGADGHPKRTDEGLLPNIDLPRRMWAGSRVRFLQDIPLEAPIVRRSTLTEATEKNGRSGRMLFVTLLHEIAEEGCANAILEEQDIVYRAPAAIASPASPAAAAVEASAPMSRTLAPDPVMLFRYSALTFNSHRIHYDRDYSRLEEGYPGLVVQGPLIATLLLDHLLRELPGALPARYEFRALSPSFDGDPLTLELDSSDSGINLRAIGRAGIAMTATAELRS